MKKAVFILLAVLSVATGIGSLVLSVSKPTYAVFYIFLGLILALFPFSPTKERKTLLIAFAFIGLFLTIGLQVIFEGSLVWGLLAIAVAAAIAYKERVEIAKQYRDLTNQTP